MDDLTAKFLPQFIKLARSRIALADKLKIERDFGSATKVLRELHTLAGEAGLLGLHAVVPLARDCEHKAKELNRTRSDADADMLGAALRELERVIDQIEMTLKTGS